MSSLRDSAVELLKQQVLKPYRWGAMGPENFDCSGLACYVLGIKEKHNAQQLADLYIEKKIDKLQAPPGSLFFYGLGPRSIDHVMIVAEHWANGTIGLIGARGGNASTVNDDMAKAQQAAVLAVFGSYWSSSFQLCVDPFMGVS